MHFTKKMASSMSALFIMMALCGLSSGFNLKMMSEPELREQKKSGASDFNFIMNVVLAGMNDDMVRKAQEELSSRFGTGLETPSSSGDQANSNEPIQLKRKKRNFDDPFFQDFNNFNSGSNFPSGGFPTDVNNNNNNNNDNNNYINYPGLPTDVNNNNNNNNDNNNYINYPGISSSSNSNSNSFHSWGRRLVCPRQVDQGRRYAYGSNPASYPAVEIGQELFVRSLPGSDLLFQSLSRTIVLPTDPPQIFKDPFLAKSNATCLAAEDQVWSYDSLIYTGRCYPLVNFQETPFFTTCLNRYCRNCRTSSYYSFYTANICVTEYRQVSLFSYCESLLPNRRIVFDRILVPDSCACTTVHCRDPWRRHW